MQRISVVAVEAHPDDVEMHCMGTLLLLRQQNAKITIISVSNGDKGAAHQPKRQYGRIARTRMEEAAAAAEMLGAEFVSLGAEDGYIEATPALLNDLTAAIRNGSADVVLAPNPDDYHLDHIVTSQLAFQASYYAALPQLPIDGACLSASPRLWYYDSTCGVDFQPETYVDVSSVIEEKRALARLHASQMENMRRIGGWDLVEHIEIVGRFRGLQSGVQYAEAFSSCRRFPRNHALSVLPL